MNCSGFERWLDEGRRGADRPAAERHARECDECATRLRVTSEIEDLLGCRFAAAPPSLTDRVMASLPPRPLHRDPPMPELELPWWVRMVQEPLTAISLVACGVLLVALPDLARIAQSLLPGAQQLLDQGFRGIESRMDPLSPGRFATGMIVFAALASPALFRHLARRLAGFW